MKFTERPPHQTHKKKKYFQMNQQPPDLSKKCMTFGNAVDPTPYKVPDISFLHPVQVFATYASFWISHKQQHAAHNKLLPWDVIL